MYWNSEIELENGCWMSIYDLYTKIYEATTGMNILIQMKK